MTDQASPDPTPADDEQADGTLPRSGDPADPVDDDPDGNELSHVDDDD